MISFNHTNLEVIGYAEALLEDSTPRLVWPVYHVKETDKYFVPTRILEEIVIADEVIGKKELAKYLQQNVQATYFDNAIKAKPRHGMWVDTNFKIHYEPLEEIKKTLTRISRQYCEDAFSQLIQKNYDLASMLYQRAINSDETNIDGYIGKLVVHKIEAKHDRFEFLMELTHQIFPDKKQHVEYKVNELVDKVHK